MGIVQVFTAARMAAIEAASVISGAVNGVSGHLILTKHDGSTIDAGNVVGPAGTYPHASTAAEGTVFLASDADATTGTDAAKALTPHAMQAAMVNDRSHTGVVDPLWTVGRPTVTLNSPLADGTTTVVAFLSASAADVLPGASVLLVHTSAGGWIITNSYASGPAFPRQIPLVPLVGLTPYADTPAVLSDPGNPWHRPTVSKTSASMVTIKGLVYNSTGAIIAANTVLYTLAAAFRPLQQKRFVMQIGAAYGGLIIETNGNVYSDIAIPVANSILLDAAWTNDPAIVWTNLTYGTTWSLSSATGAATPRVGVDSVGRVWFEGLLKATNTANALAAIPAGFRWTGNGGINNAGLFTTYELSNASRVARVDAPASGGGGLAANQQILVTSTTAVTGISLDAIQYPNGNPTYPAQPPLLAGSNYVQGYNSFAIYQFSDGGVKLRGLVAAEPAGANLGFLPVGWRPANRMRFIANQTNNADYMDILPNGQIVLGGAATSFLNFENVNFIAEQ